jgi:hypothetical protein
MPPVNIAGQQVFMTLTGLSDGPAAGNGNPASQIYHPALFF